MFEPLYLKKYYLILLSGGLINNNLKSLLIHSNLTILEKIFEIFSKYDESKILKRFITLPENYLNYFNNIPYKNLQNIKNYLLKYEVIDSGEKLLDTIKNVINRILNLKETESDIYLLFVATDTPFITYESINDIIFRLDYIEGDVFLPIVSKEVYEVRYSNRASKLRTFVRFKNDSFCNTSLFIIKSQIIGNFLDLLENIIKNRKKPLKLAEIFGYDILFKLILKNLAIIELEERINKLFNVKAHAILTNYAELAFNIDKKQDLEFYYKLIASNKANL
jgi:hypothetical protein